MLDCRYMSGMYFALMPTQRRCLRLRAEVQGCGCLGMRVFWGLEVTILRVRGERSRFGVPRSQDTVRLCSSGERVSLFELYADAKYSQKHLWGSLRAWKVHN